ncbi:hypothetical protein AIOL_004612 [Candidatus Rhodobacter oscarellae]|uniref:DUF2147 domain-containing protein n=1 Tax=Candidatus Rhodobacter oscarellae TaxID=1675527 RepID=A0A0J9EA29_9RHOB|nr:DUF2147 domain-containing protein [Candidatus Rhodobacter lobularis]KMW59630.1 hypothetical protein AIOL_004612 [Candidatus Rhodobacter lobularis]
MKKLILASAALIASTVFAAADAVHGTWKSPTNEDGAYLHVKIDACGSDICGVITKVGGGGDTSSVGKQMIWGMKPSGGGVYKGGKVWAPDNDKTYRGKLTLSGSNMVKIEGCVLGGAVCRGETFSRIN